MKIWKGATFSKKIMNILYLVMTKFMMANFQ